MEQETLKTTLKAPKANKATTGIIGACSSAKEVAEAIAAFWGNGDLGSDEKFIIKKLSQLAQQDAPSETDIVGFTGMTTALMGKTLKSATTKMFMGSSLMLMQFLTPAAQALNVSWHNLNTERAWKFVFVSGDFFRIRAAAIAWHAANSVEDKDAAAEQLRSLVSPIQETSGAIKGGSVALLLNRIGDQLNNRAVNIFAMIKTSAEKPKPATINQDEAGQKLSITKQSGADLLNGLSKPADAAVSDAKQLVSKLLDAQNPDASVLKDIETFFGSNNEKVVDALINGRFGFGSAAKLDGCQNYSQKAQPGAGKWLKEFISQPIEAVSPVIDEVREKFLSASGLSDGDATEWVNGITISKKLIAEYDGYAGKDGAFIQDLKDVYRLAGGKISTLTQINLHRSRSYASQSKRLIALEPRSGKRTLWHEVGHHFEYSNPDYLKMALSYLTERAGGNRSAIRPLKRFFYSHYAASEVGITDQLSSPYAGKVYGEKGLSDIHAARATEIFSSAFEYLAKSNLGAVSLLNDDQLLQFVCGVLKGVHGL